VHKIDEADKKIQDEAVKAKGWFSKGWKENRDFFLPLFHILRL
jgi:hypothetical protein